MESSSGVTRDQEIIDAYSRYFVNVLVQKLDAVLQGHDLEEEQRMMICQGFVNKMVLYLDEGWIENEQGRLFPTLVFGKDGEEGPEYVLPEYKHSLEELGTGDAAVAYQFERTDDQDDWMQFTFGLNDGVSDED